MEYYAEEERAPRCSLLDVPLIAAGAVSDSLCCKGPKRDFATEVEFRLANAAKMYPAGYTDVPSYAYRSRYQYSGNPPSYWQYKPPTMVNYPSEVPQVCTSPVGYYPYPVQRTTQPQRWTYYPEPESYSLSRPVVPQAEVAYPGPLSSSWTGALGGVSQSPLQSSAIPAQLGLTVETPQPDVAPSNEVFTPRGWQTVEVVEVLLAEQAKKTGPSQEKKEQASPGQLFESRASQTEPKNDVSRAVKEGKTAQRAPAAKRKPAAAKKGQRGQAHLQQPEGDEAIRDDTAPEPTKAATQDNKSASTPLVEAEQSGGRAEPEGHAKEPVNATKQEEQREDAVEGTEKAVGKQQPSKGLDEQAAVGASAKNEQAAVGEKDGKVSADEPSVGGEKKDKLPNSGTQVPFQMENAPGDKPSGFAFISVEVSAPSVGSSMGHALPQPQRSPGHFCASPAEMIAGPSGVTSGWPVGYVPPPDDKYKELVVGNQVYLEGGTFYLSETGAYLLGLRD
ncbi:uncharacterized protein EMH_0003910 [Eimeria mitis]|uniref:Uncharacterized protein n=1 Tax=Eimeria mitis TaxID=44415 RepID=U6KEN2_9EIME|nr:uncharacterized protein EMH_0003910 [Eimeria mitis]CDJ35261.1 hypothetical protein, conserved [Eimeria mitis]